MLARMRNIVGNLLGNARGSSARTGLNVAFDFLKRTPLRDNLKDADNLYLAVVGTAAALRKHPAPIPLTSGLCQQAHFMLDEYRYWSAAIHEAPRFHRKQWEFFFIAQALFERGMLEPGRQGLGFAVGAEPLPALFASRSVTVVASDQDTDSAVASSWTTAEHCSERALLNVRGICEAGAFDRLVGFREIDMRSIPPDLDGRFDFCWSACALEHLGSLDAGIRFIDEAMRVLKPGGIAVHTTEFNLSSNDETLENDNTCIYRRRDIERAVALLGGKGYQVEPIDWSMGGGFIQRLVDLPPYTHDPHIRLQVLGYDCTSFGIIVRKSG